MMLRKGTDSADARRYLNNRFGVVSRLQVSSMVCLTWSLYHLIGYAVLYPLPGTIVVVGIEAF